MANRTLVTGTITVKANNPKMVLDKLFTVTNNWYFSFNQEDEIEVSEDGLSASVTFSAEGRWSFLNNIQMLGLWLKGTVGKKEGIAKRYLARYPYVMKLEYTEECEFGSFIGSGRATITHKENSPLRDLIVSDATDTQYDYTVENLVNVLGYDEDYAKRQCFADRNVA